MDAYVLVAVAKHIQVQKSLRGGDGLNSKGGLWSNADGGQLSHDSFKRYWGKARKELKKQYPEIGHIRPHDLRKSMGSWLAEHPEVTLVEGMEVLRHKKLSTFTDYYVRNRPGKRPAIRGAIREYLSPVGEAPRSCRKFSACWHCPLVRVRTTQDLGSPFVQRRTPSTCE
jgi:integrase